MSVQKKFWNFYCTPRSAVVLPSVRRLNLDDSDVNELVCAATTGLLLTATTG